MNQALHDELVRAARGQTTLYYSDVAPLVSLDMSLQHDRAEIGRLLGEISEHEHEHGRPLLSALVVARDTGRPGLGFFNLARQLGVHSGHDDDAFWANELARVHREWRPQGAERSGNP